MHNSTTVTGKGQTVMVVAAAAVGCWRMDVSTDSQTQAEQFETERERNGETKGDTYARLCSTIMKKRKREREREREREKS